MAMTLDSIIALATKADADASNEIAQTRHEKSRFNRMYEARLSELNSIKEDQRLLKEKVNSEKKMEKVREDFLKKMMSQGSGPMAVGSNLVDSLSVPAEEGAGDFPIMPSP